ncbi:ankyrin repeat-containing domain protein [Sporodiniella umbellata]|nr:ankyrin repeat-containing domain protein [Sporodiniella umbellata]
MFTDEREDTLREVASLGNIKAVLHFCHSGVNVNAQHKMNGWTALHWAAHRGHTEVVMALLKSGANPSLLTGKGQTALDLAVLHTQCSDLLTQAMGGEATVRAEPEPQLPIQPTYMKNPDLEKTWLMPDEFTENKFENVLKRQQAQEVSPPVTQQPAGDNEKEILIYLSARLDDALLGSVYLSNQSIESAIEVIKQVGYVA